MGKSSEVRVTHTALEDFVLASLREFDEKRKCSPELLRLSNLPIEILEVDTGSTIRDVRKNNRLKYMCHLPTIVVERGNTMLLAIMYHLVEPSEAARCFSRSTFLASWADRNEPIYCIEGSSALSRLATRSELSLGVRSAPPGWTAPNVPS